MFRFNFDGSDVQQTDAEPISIQSDVACEDLPICQVECVDLAVELPAAAAAAQTGAPAAESHLEIVFTGSDWSFKQSVVDHRHLRKRQIELDAILERSDLVPNVYEGGFKLWECSVDLVQYLIDEHVSIAAGHVLELGCGHGLPGIYAACHGASTVCFQDLNIDVLRSVTVSNLIGNAIPSSRAVQLVAGDWRDPALLASITQHRLGQYDLIFSCDTLYSIDSHPALLRMIEACLRPEGSAYIAAKSFYFGVGGSTLSFLDLIQRRYRNLQAVVVRTIADGQSNVREILRITKLLS